jgi:NAD(P)-dependent dehydrogenase (short-subunit alcohol dehydrogenase family)
MSTQSEIDGERGVIINVSSILAKYGDFVTSAYSASKGGVSGMTLALARDFSAHKVRINAICPGLAETPMIGRLPEAVKNLIKSQSTAGVLLEPEQFAHFVQTIVENKYISGSNLPLDGGQVPCNTRGLNLP